jgi:hypothetical protein
VPLYIASSAFWYGTPPRSCHCNRCRASQSQPATRDACGTAASKAACSAPQQGPSPRCRARYCKPQPYARSLTLKAIPHLLHTVRINADGWLPPSQAAPIPELQFRLDRRTGIFHDPQDGSAREVVLGTAEGLVYLAALTDSDAYRWVDMLQEAVDAAPLVWMERMEGAMPACSSSGDAIRIIPQR